MKERIQRHNDGEILDDLFHPLLENSKGVEPDISMEDRIAEVEQNGKQVLEYPPTTEPSIFMALSSFTTIC